MTRIKLAIGCLILSLGVTVNAKAQSFDDYVLSLKHQALEKGYSQPLIDEAFNNVKLRKKVIYSDKNQPEFRLTLDTYIPRALPKWKVAKARKLYKQYYPLLTKISAQYHVQPRFIVALWGIESNFGNLTGRYDVMSALTSLAYDGRRRAFFERQIMASLAIMKKDGISRSTLKGSWAGAMGQVQFMPGTYLAYAVDGDGDGKSDLWNSVPDALASAANYLNKIGWRDDMTWGRQVHLPKDFDLKTLDIKSAKLLSEWEKLGVRRYSDQALPTRQIKARLVVPDDRNGRIYLVYHNYETLLKWNRSNYFAITVGSLADRIAYPPVDLR